ncbi:hypothetical protein H0Z60_17530 [Ectothiorhodospiraceae bacterium WFHF3C12]|nr:hypothetical protein [Ectothiorhodospiraceae bacterium WFHF3C12]
MPIRLNVILASMLLTLASALAPNAAAQEDGARDWYTVEVIIFRHWASADSERFRADLAAPAFERLTVLRGDGTRAFRRLPGGELGLQGARERLERSPDYEVLDHFGWQQPALTEEEAISIALPLNWQPSPLTFDASIHSLGVPVITPPEKPKPGSEAMNEAHSTGDAGTTSGDGTNTADATEPAPVPGIFDELSRDTRLYGTLTLFRGRYLHIDADLRYRMRRYQASWTEREFQSGPPVYVLTQRRRMRSGELHYLDHPALGLLIKVTPLEAEPDANAEAREAGTPSDSAQ